MYHPRIPSFFQIVANASYLLLVKLYCGFKVEGGERRERRRRRMGGREGGEGEDMYFCNEALSQDLQLAFVPTINLEHNTIKKFHS